MTRRVIGLVGLSYSGKSEIAKIIQRRIACERLRFAAPLKAGFAAMLRQAGVDEETIGEMIEGSLKRAPHPLLGGKTPQQAMQTLGTEWGRSVIGGDFWVGLWRARAAASHGPVVAEDVRMPNEAAAVRAVRGELWRVVRPGVEQGEHESETAQAAIQCDQYIHNSGTLDDLERAVAALL